MAVILVVAYHAGLRVSGGYTGVDVFFVISGFVITTMLLRESESTGSISLREFYSRRARRIIPALAVMIAVVMSGAMFLLSPLGPQAQTAHTGVAAALFGANMQLYSTSAGYFAVPAAQNALLHTWSLSVEEQFYLAFPLVLLAALGLRRRRHARSNRGRAVAVLGAVATASFVVSWRLSAGPAPDGSLSHAALFAFYGSPTRAWEFLAGALIALGTPTWRRMPARLAAWAGAAGMGAIVLAAATFRASTAFPGTAALLPVVGAGLVIICGARGAGLVPATLGVAPAVAVGDMSYSWYLWHWPAIVFGQAAWPGVRHIALVCAVMSLVPAWLSYRYVESRYRSRPGLAGRRLLGLAAAGIAVPVLLGLAVGPVSTARQSPATRHLVAAYALHADTVRGCSGFQPLLARASHCTWSTPHPIGTVVLVGDSNAGQFTEPLASAANALHYNLLVSTSAGCGFDDAVAIDGGRPWAQCANFVDQSVSALIKLRPTLVFVSSSTPGIISNAGRSLEDPATGRIARSAGDKLQVFADTLGEMLRRLEDAGVRVVLVHTAPHFRAWDPVTCGLDVYLRPSSCAISQARVVLDEVRDPSFDAESEAVRSAPGAAALDVAGDLCSTPICSTLRGDVWLYRDDRHISVPGALTLTPTFEAAIEANAAPERVG